MKTKFFLPVIAAFIVFSSAGLFAQSRLGVKINFTEQETRELAKLKNSGVVLRTVFAQLASKENNQPRKKVEEMLFNKSGLPVEKIRYNTFGKVDEKTVFKYNAKGIQTGRIVYNGANTIVEKESDKIDKRGNTTEIKSENLIRGVMHSTRRAFVYDKKGVLTEIRGYETGRDFVVKEVYEYKDGLMTSKKQYNSEGVFLGSEVYSYDSLKRKVDEEDIMIRFQPEKDSASGKMVNVAYQEKAEFKFKYDDKGNLSDIFAPDYHQVFTYNDKGDCTRDIIYDKLGRRQNDNEFIYGDDGLLKRIVRYYGDGSPGAYIDYTYEKSNK